FEVINKQLTSPDVSFPSISLSVGITLCQEGDDFKSVYNRADKALYYVKEHGRCGYRVYGEE
ncbi:MAG: diguanylate cyclase, partial [Eubacterium sp.]|nr:diguanylate cyclase [Eubacterium sp.]